MESLKNLHLMESLKNLYLDRTKIEEAIKNYGESMGTELKFNCDPKDNIRHRWTIYTENDSFYIDMHYKKNETTTIDLSGGKQSTLRNSLSEYIRDYCCIKVQESNESWFTVRNIDNKDFEPLIALLKESKYYDNEEITNDSDNTYTIKIFGHFGEKLTIHYYKHKGTVLLQGKPLLLFSDARSYLCTLLDEENVTKTLNVNYKVSISLKHIENLAERYYPNSLKKIKSNKVVNSFKQAVYYYELCNDGNFEMFNYTSCVFDAYRALEGVMRQFFYEIELDMQDFHILNTNGEIEEYVLTPIKKKYIDHVPVTEFLKCFYNLYQKRNAFFHIKKMNEFTYKKGNDLSPIIASKSEAQEHIKDVLSLIENFYTHISD